MRAGRGEGNKERKGDRGNKGGKGEKERKGERGKAGLRRRKTEEQGSEDSGHSSLGVVPSDVFY